MFGAALFGAGFLTWSLARSAGATAERETLHSILRSLALGNLVAAFVAITQQSSVWLTPVGWVMTGIFRLVWTLIRGDHSNRVQKMTAFNMFASKAAVCFIRLST